MTDTARASPDTPAPPRQASAGFMLRHPAHLLALGFGAGLSPKAPGTVGTLWAWLSFEVLGLYLGPQALAWLMLAALVLGWWVSMLTARHLQVLDPGCIVVDEIAAFWLVLWVLDVQSWALGLLAFALFRFFDARKPGPVAWADRLAHQVKPQTDPRGWAKIGAGIMLDDYVAAACTLLVIGLIQWALRLSGVWPGLLAYLQ